MAKVYEVAANTLNMERSAWLEARKTGIGGSDAAAIIGATPYRTPLEVYADKKGLSLPKEETEAMRLGRDLESYVAERFTEQTGLKVRRENHILRSVEHPCMIANVDRMVVGENAGLECKTTSSWNWGDGTVPPSYYAQSLHYMAVTGADHWYLAVLVWGEGFHTFRIERSDEDVRCLVEAEEAFWMEHVVANVPPAPSGTKGDEQVIRSMAQDAKQEETVTLDGLDATCERIVEIKTQIDALSDEKARLEQEVKMQMGGAQCAAGERHVVTWKETTRRSVDTKALKAGAPDVYSAYLKATTYRRFEVKERR